MQRKISLFFFLFSLCLFGKYSELCSNDNPSTVVSDVFVFMADRAVPAVVYIEAEGHSQRYEHPFAQHPFADEFFKRFFGIDPESREEMAPAQLQRGSGFLISAEGHILTNYHVIKGAEEKIRVTLHDRKKQYDASLVGKDAVTDLAVIKIEEEALAFLELGNSEELRVGEVVAAIGSPFGPDFSSTFTTGVVSAKGRDLYDPAEQLQIRDFIQTDAAINMGNSGGPLVNQKGQVVGINTLLVNPHGRGFTGLGFAIPSNIAKRAVEDLLEKGMTEYGYIGMEVRPMGEELITYFKENYSFEGSGLEIIKVVEGEAAEKAGLKPQDIIVSIDGEEIDSFGKLGQKIRLLEPGTVIQVTVNRKGKWLNFKIKLGTLPDHSSHKQLQEELGFEVAELSPEERRRFGYKQKHGVIISKATPKARRIQLQEQLLITEVNGQEVKGVDDFYKKVEEGKKKSQYILLTVTRGRHSYFVTIPLK